MLSHFIPPTTPVSWGTSPFFRKEDLRPFCGAVPYSTSHQPPATTVSTFPVRLLRWLDDGDKRLLSPVLRWENWGAEVSNHLSRAPCDHMAELGHKPGFRSFLLWPRVASALKKSAEDPLWQTFVLLGNNSHGRRPRWQERGGEIGRKDFFSLYGEKKGDSLESNCVISSQHL